MAAKQLKVNSFTTRQFVADGLLVKQLAAQVGCQTLCSRQFAAETAGSEQVRS
jgi:hypothetical protein